jgi:lipoate-protein ligase A
MFVTKPSSRLLHDPPGSGAWNMAIDEVLLESALRDGMMSMRFYRWSEPTLSLGYFQHYADRQVHVKSRDCPAVRRPSGGGAIMHDQELTYSLAVPAGLSLAQDARALYDAAHESLVDAFASWGLRAKRHIQRAGDKHAASSRGSAKPEEPFLCFQRVTCGDVLIDRWKVGGSAQRRSKGAILQHGSVLLGMAAAATELPGVREITGVTMLENELFAAWYHRLAQRLGVRAVRGELTESELAEARALTLSKHAAEAWVRRR